MNVVFRVTSAGATDVGRRRAHNEDFLGWFEPHDESTLRASGRLYVVADGVGGAAYGERASRYAVQKVLYTYYRRADVPPAERLAQAIQEASREIYAYSQQEAVGRPVATTLVAAVVWQHTLIVANVGDSRAYLLRNGVAEQITRDHNLGEEMVREGLMSAEEAREARIRNRLTRSLGGRPAPEVDIFTRTLQPGDRVLLCSDGLTRYASAEDLARLAAEGNPQEVVERLIAFANRAGGADNISALLVEIGEPLPSEVLADAHPAVLPPPPEGLGLVDSEASSEAETLAAPPTPSAAPQGFSRRWWLAMALLFLVGCGVGMGGVALGRALLAPAPTTAPLVASPTPQPPPSTPSPLPSPTATLTPAPTAAAVVPPTATASPGITPAPSLTPLPAGVYACTGEIGPGGSFYGLLARMGLIPVAAREPFWASVASWGRFRQVLYAEQRTLPPPDQPVDFRVFQTIDVPTVAPDKDPRAWTAFEDQLRRFSPTTVVVVPLVNRTMCEQGTGWWQRFQSLPPWMRTLPTWTPAPTPGG